MRALDRKLLRELGGMRGQMLSIAGVVACGVLTVVALRGTYEALASALERYYRTHRFADLFVTLERAPEPIADRVRALPGVAEVQTRVQRLVTLEVEGLDEPATGLLLSIPPTPSPTLNAVHLVRGRWPSPEADDEVLVSQSFFDANRLSLDARVGALIEQRWRTLRIVGVALSPDYIGELPPGGAFPDDRRFAILRMNREVLGPAVGMEGAFNDLSVALGPGARAEEVKAALDRLMEPWGGRGAQTRDEQPSHLMVQGELNQNRLTGTLIPAIFLGVAAFLLNIVLSRLVGTQRGEIAVLKAFGYTHRQVGGHYLRFALVAAFGGLLVGVAGGAWAGSALTEVYGQFFRFPELGYRLRPGLVAVAAWVTLVAATLGALGAVRRAFRLPPAEAMRPELPERMRAGVLERLGLMRRLSAPVRLVVRNLERRPLRSAASTVGVAMGVVLLLVGLAFYDSVERINHLQFERSQREDLSVTFIGPRADSVRHDLTALQGVTLAEVFRTVAVRVSSGPRERTVALMGIPREATLRRIVDQRGTAHPIPSDGLLLSQALAERLGVGPGDTVRIAALEGRRPEAEVKVSATVDELFGLGAYMERARLDAWMGDGPTANGAWLRVERSARERLGRELARLPAVATVYSPQALRRSFEQQIAESLLVSIGVLVVLATVLTLGIVYNGARIALAERGRELASLRVLGFTRHEVAVLLLGEQGTLALLAVPVGWVFGVGLLWLIMPAFATEQFRIPLALSPRTFALSAGVTLVAAVVAGLAVRRRLMRLDLVEVLKTRE